MNPFEEITYKIINNKKGNIYKFASEDKFPDFIKGDIYFSEVNPLTFKDWRRHTKLNCIIGVVYGEVKIKIKPNLNSDLFTETLLLKKSKLFKINAGCWYCFENEKTNPSLLFAMLNGKHNDNEVERL